MKEGQGLLLEMDYADGETHNKQRTFLIIRIYDKDVHMLNISSIKNKERKLGFKSNKKIDYYKPPFWKPSFVKLDALYIIEKNNNLNNFLLLNGRAMNPMQLNKIKTDYKNYKEEFHVSIKRNSITDVLNLNLPSLAESAMADKS